MEGFNALRHDFPKLQQVALGIHSNSQSELLGSKWHPKEVQPKSHRKFLVQLHTEPPHMTRSLSLS